MKRWAHFLLITQILALSILSCRTFSTPTVESKEITESPTTTPATITLLPTNTLPIPTSTSIPIPSTNSPPSLKIQSQIPSQPVSIDLISSQDTLVKLYQQTSKGVVAIRVLNINGGTLGSGFVFDGDGHIVTNYHVVEDVSDLEVAFSSGYRTRGKVVGIDLDSDIAVIKVNAPQEELYPLKLGDSDQVKVGQMVVAIGNPFGLEGTMTIGIVSGLGRTLPSLHLTTDGSTFTLGDVIQTDAAINPGNSGGPLLNLNGEVIGVNESIATNDGERSNSGVGFAISGNLIKRIVPALINYGRYDYPYLGISSMDEITLFHQEALGLLRATGIYISGVTPGGPADAAGLRAGRQPSSIPGIYSGGDLIIAIDGQNVSNFNDLIVYIVKYKKPGDIVSLTVIRGNEEINFELTLGSRPTQN